MHKPFIASYLFCVASCGGSDSSTEPPPPTARGIQFLSGASGADSIGAILAQPMLVEVRDSIGRLAPVGTRVRFAAVQREPLIDFEAHVRPLGSPQFEPVATGLTEANGRVSAHVRLGFVAGLARIVVSAHSLGVSDTATYTVVPGAAHGVRLEPGDTTLYVGRSYALRGGVIDRAGNLRPDPVTWSTSGAGLTVSSAGVVTAGSFGRYTIVGRYDLNSGTGVNVSVVPQARLAGALAGRIIGVDIDGANQRDFLPFLPPSVGAHPRWIPGSSALVFAQQGSATAALFLTDENRALKPFLSNPPPTLGHQAEPAPTADGAWVYFSAFDSRCSSMHPCLYRSRVDGTGAELLGNPGDFATGARQPSPSPDGAKVAYVASNAAPVIKVFDVASRTVSSWSVAGRHPAWSPTGTYIAFTPNGGGPIMLMNADGTGVHALTTIAFDEEPLTWSREGRWLIARFSTFGVVLVDVTSGDVIPVKLLAGALAAPSIR